MCNIFKYYGLHLQYNSQQASQALTAYHTRSSWFIYQSISHPQTLLFGKEVQVVVSPSHPIVPLEHWSMSSTWYLQLTSWPQLRVMTGPLGWLVTQIYYQEMEPISEVVDDEQVLDTERRGGESVSKNLINICRIKNSFQINITNAHT